MAAAGVLTLLAAAVPAHAQRVDVPLPQTPGQIPPVQVPQVQVTTPGVTVTAGPGGASVTIHAQQAAAPLPGNLSPPPTPPVTPPADTGSTTTPAPQGGSTTGEGGSAGDRVSSERASTPSRRAAGSNGSAAANGSATTTPAAAATPVPRAGRRATGRGERRTAPRTRARDEAPRTNPVRQVIERIPNELLAALLVLALFAAAMSLVWLRERGRVRAARRMAQVDPLTGISNRLAFENRLSDEWTRARRYDRPLGLLLLDLDGLKRVNDRDGHQAGDRMIQAAASRIAEDLRQSDMAARLAGDEFVVLCPETPRDGIERLGSKLSKRLDDVGIAASVGWAELSDADIRPNDLLARADAAMYDDKARRGTGRGVKAPAGLATAG